MTDRTYGITEVVGTSEHSLEDSIRNAVARASKTLRHLDWFEVTQIRGHLDDAGIQHFQSTVKLGFRLEDD